MIRKKIFLILPLFCVLNYNQVGCLRNESELWKAYKDFREKYHREDQLLDEIVFRFNVFKSNMELIDELNGNNSTSKFGINQFADRTKEELQLPALSNSQKTPYTFLSGIDWWELSWNGYTTIPSSLDLRQHGVVSPVKSQDTKCNSCWAYSVTGLVESLYLMKNWKIELSEHEMIECDWNNYGCIGGSTRNALIYGKTKGFTSKWAYPVMMGDSRFCPAKGMYFLRNLYRIKPDHNSIAWFIATQAPVVLNFVVTNEHRFYKNGILSPSIDCNIPPNHSALAIGYGEEDGVKYWIIKNSWGSSWGEKGFMKIRRGTDACRIESHPLSADIVYLY